MQPFTFTQAAVVGLGKSGRAAIDLLLERGVRVIGVDEKGEVEDADALRVKGVLLKLGGITAEALLGCQVVVVSPGVPLDKPVLREAAASGVPVIGEIELAYRLLLTGAGPLLGITGTNGKSTTTALLGHLLEKSGRKTFVGGNLGRPLSEACAERFDVHVVEMSSFQLEGIDTASFVGGAILNITPDHLDRYPDPRAYAAAKGRIFENTPTSGFAVVNADDVAVVALARGAQERLARLKTSYLPVYGFSMKPGMSGFDGMALAEEGGFQFTFGEKMRFTLANRALRGAHNLQNAMAAALMAHLHGVSADAIARGLESFGGLPHRLELAREHGGIEWINDSKATNVDSSVVALRALPGRIWLIAGGKGKGAPYAPLVQAAQGKLFGVLTIGQDAATVAQAFTGTCPIHDCQTLERAVSKAMELAKAGDTVLLSPACASYDQFKNFEARGDTFKRLVRSL